MDISLVKSARKGNIEDFEKIILDVENDLYRIAMIRLNRNYEDVNDAVQNTIIKAFKNIRKLRNPKNYKTWIIKILINECNNLILENFRFKKIKEKSKIYLDLSYIDIYEDTELEKIFKGISKEELLVLKLFYEYKYSYKEIALILNKNINTLKSIVLRAKEKVKKNVIKEKKNEN